VYIYVCVSNTRGCVQRVPSSLLNVQLCYIYFICVCVVCDWGLYRVVQNWILGWLKQGYIPFGGSSEGVCKHSAGEGWASDISRPRVWEWDRPCYVCTSHTPVTQVGNTTVYQCRELMILCRLKIRQLYVYSWAWCGHKLYEVVHTLKTISAV
jgi:hypothetical protein